jgi:uncharacterized protein
MFTCNSKASAPKKPIIAFLIIFALLLSPLFVHALRPGYVYDRAQVLTTEDRAAIDYFCEQIERNYTSEIVVVTLPDLNQYGGDMSKARETIFNDESLDGVVGIGKAKQDNGVLIVIAIAERKWGIEVGYGLEGSLTDSEAGRIGRDIMLPYLKNEEYYYALMRGAMSVADEIRGESTLPPEDPNFLSDQDTQILVIIVFALFLGVAFYVKRRGGGSGSGYGGWGGGYGGGGSGGGGSGGGGSGGGGAGGGW